MGDVMLDVVVAVTAPFAHASDTPSAISTSPGGSAANQSVAMAHEGLSVALLGMVGSDPIGDAAATALRAAGVDVTMLARSDRPTGVVIALVERDGQRSMLTDRGANLALDSATVEPLAARLDEHGHVHVSGYCLLDEETRAAGLRALEIARSRGASASVDASSAGPLRAVGADRFLSWVGAVRYLFCNEEEGSVLSGQSDPASIALELATHADEVVVTLGAAGALVAVGDRLTAHDAHSTTAVSDTTGAGDAFSGAYLAGRLAGRGIPASLDMASAAAAHAIAVRGARGWS